MRTPWLTRIIPYFFSLACLFTERAIAANNGSIFSIPAIDLWRQFQVDGQHRTLIWANPDSGVVTIQDLTDGTIRAQLQVPGQVRQIAITDDGRWLYATRSAALDDPQWSRQVTEIDLETLTIRREIALPADPEFFVVGSDRTAVVSVPHDVGPRYLQLQLVDLKDGRQGESTDFLYEPLRLGPDGRSLFVRGLGDKTENLNRQSFDPVTLTWGAVKRLTRSGPVGAPVEVPLGFSTDGRTAVTRFQIFVNDPADPADMGAGIRIREPYPYGVAFSSQATNFFLGDSFGPGLHIFQRDSGTIVGFVPGPDFQSFFYVGSELFALIPGATEFEYDLIKMADPLAGLDTNQPPIARLAQPVGRVTTSSPTKLDASGSSDDLTPPEHLRFRWDLEGDGDWDTPLQNSPLFEYRLIETGPRIVRVQVMDNGGATHSAEISLNVEFDPIPASPVTDVAPDILPFGPAAVAFDVNQHRLYAADAAGRIVRMNLTNGLCEASWPLYGTFVAMALQPNGQRLYVAELRPELIPIGANTNVFLTEIDLEAETRGREIHLGTALGGLAATDTGIVIASGDRIRTYRWPDVQPVSVSNVGLSGPLILHPNHYTVYGFTQDNPSDSYLRIRFDPTTGAFQNVYRRIMPAAYLFNADQGTHFVTATSLLLRATPDAPTDLVIVPEVTLPLEIFGVVDLPQNGLVALRMFSRYEFYQPENWSLVVAQAAEPGFAHLAADTQWLYELRGPRFPTEMRLERRTLPAATAEENRPPVIAWVGVTNQVLQRNQTVRLLSQALDPDGAIVRVEYWANGTNVATVLPPSGVPPIPGSTPELFPFDFAPLLPGRYLLSAVAVDNFGATRASDEVEIRVNSPPELAAGEIQNTNWMSPISFYLPVTAGDPDGKILRVTLEFMGISPGRYRLLGERTKPPFDFQINGLSGFPGHLRLSAFDNEGAVTRLLIDLPLLRPPAGDDPLRPLLITNDVARIYADLRQATCDSSEAMFGRLPPPLVPACYSWEWTAPGDRLVTVDTFGSSFDTGLQVNRVDDGRPQAVIVRNDDDFHRVPWSRLKFEARAGQRYQIYAYGINDRDLGDLVLNFVAVPWIAPTPTSPPPNDHFAAAVPLVANDPPTPGTTRGATGESNRDHTRGGTNSVWYYWVATTDGLAEVSTTQVTGDTVVTVFTNPGRIIRGHSDDRNLEDPSSLARFRARAGETNWIQVGAYAPTEGDFQIQIRFPVDDLFTSPPANDEFTNASPVLGEYVTIPGTTAGATADRLGASPETWWRWIAPVDGPVHAAAVGWLSPLSPVPRIRVYQGSQADTLVPAPDAIPDWLTSQNTSAHRFLATQGQTYYLAIGSAVNADFFITINAGMRPGILMATLVDPPESPAVLRVQSSYPRQVTLERSSDLLNWFPSDRYELQSEPMDLPLPNFSTAVLEYFRISAY